MIRMFLAFYLPLIVAYGDTFLWIYDRWNTPGGYYSHGPLLPILGLFVIWTQRAEWSKIEARTDMRGWWFLAFGLFLRLCGAAQMVDSLSAASLLFSLTGIVLLTVGWGRLRKILPVILLVGFATPMPMDLTGRVAFELKEIAINTAMVLGNALGLEAVREGASIKVPGQKLPLPIADACGGLRSLLALTALGYCLAFFIGSANVMRRITILVVTVPVAVMVNVLRIVGLCFMAKHVDVHYAGGTGHTIMNGISWVVNIVVLISLDGFLEKRIRRKRSRAKEGKE
jgi:exosortase